MKTRIAVLMIAILCWATSLGNARPLAERGNYMTEETSTVKKRDLVVTRVFDTNVEQVWKAWSEPEQVKRWLGPNGFTAPIARIDFREGGTSLVNMRAPNGREFYNTWAYGKIVPMRLIEFIMDWADKDGNRTDPATMGLPPNMPRDVRHVVTLKDLGNNKTEMTVTEYGYTSDQQFELSRAGLEQCLDKMAAIFLKAQEQQNEKAILANECRFGRLHGRTQP